MIRLEFARLRLVRRRCAGTICGVCVVLANAAASAQTLGQAPADDISYWRVAFDLVLCLTLAVAGAYLLKARAGNGVASRPLRFISSRAPRRLKLVETLRLGQKFDLSIVTCDGHEILVLANENHAAIVDTLPGTNISNPRAAARDL
jgi:hypothetical protein